MRKGVELSFVTNRKLYLSELIFNINVPWMQLN